MPLKKLLIYRKKLGLTQKELAEKIPCSPKAIQLWETGEQLPSLYSILKISESLNITKQQVMDLFDDITTD